MDREALNYLNTAVLNDGSCIYKNNSEIGKKAWSVYNSPGFINITINDIANLHPDEKFLSIYSISGEVVYSSILREDEVINIITNNWPSGVYYAVIKMENRNLTHKFAVE